jgi:hypothetical protein
VLCEDIRLLWQANMVFVISHNQLRYGKYSANEAGMWCSLNDGEVQQANMALLSRIEITCYASRR